MKTTPVTPADLQSSVIAVPPLCLDESGRIDRIQNRRLIDHLLGGGITTFMYGGNANFYNMPLADMEDFYEFAESLDCADAWILPAVGPDYGNLQIQTALVKASRFPTVMVLPMAAISTSAGVANGIRRFSDAIGRPVILYIKREGYITPEDAGRLAADGIIAGIKYAIVREDPADDAYLTRLIETVDRNLIISGIGERPVIVHWQKFGLRSFTSGSCCVAPALSTAILKALQAGDIARAEEIRAKFIPFEDLRDGINPIRVLHCGVDAAGIARTGDLRPMMSNLTQEEAARVAPAAKALLAEEQAFAGQDLAATA